MINQNEETFQISYTCLGVLFSVVCFSLAFFFLYFKNARWRNTHKKEFLGNHSASHKF